MVYFKANTGRDWKLSNNIAHPLYVQKLYFSGDLFAEIC